MREMMTMLVAGAMLAGTACTSTSTSTGTTGSGSGSMSGSASGTATSSGTMGGGSTTTGGGTTGGTTGTSMGTTTGGGTTTGTTTGGGTTGTAGAGATGGTMSAGAGTTMDMTNMTDAMFMMTAASSNMFEIQAGKLATQNSTNADVKKFAQMMIDHHTKASQEQMTLASQMKITLPTTLMPVHQTMLDRLKAKTGKGFDEDYMDAMETAHKMDIAMFQLKSTNAETPPVKALAAKTLPMLKSHQEMATTLEDKVD